MSSNNALAKTQPAITALAAQNLVSPETLEKALIGGDLAGLTPPQRLELVTGICKSLGLNPLTRPFEYMEFDGKTLLYARKDAAEQLRATRGISLKISDRRIEDGVYSVTAIAVMPDGRTDESVGAVPFVKEGGEWKTAQGSGKRYFATNGSVAPLRPEERANAIMKAETKAKRRVTLSICGLGMPDETELETMPGAWPTETVEQVSQRRIAEETAKAAAARPVPQPQAVPAPGPKTMDTPNEAEFERQFRAADKYGKLKCFKALKEQYCQLLGKEKGEMRYYDHLSACDAEHADKLKTLADAIRCAKAMYRDTEALMAGARAFDAQATEGKDDWVPEFGGSDGETT